MPVLLPYIDDVDATDSVHGLTPLASVIEGTELRWKFSLAPARLEILQWLISCKASVNGTPQCRPIDIAAQAGNPEIVEMLLAHKADLSPVDGSPSPMLMACERGHEEVARLLLTAKAATDYESDDDTCLGTAASGGHTAIAAMLLQFKADARLVDKHGCSALLSAAQYGRLPIVLLLLERNADVNVYDADGDSALSCASEFASSAEHLKIIDVLLQHKADPTHANNDGVTALDGAQQRNLTEAVKILEAAMSGPGRGPAE